MPEPRFVFRAAVVLDLRRRQDQEAQGALRAANLSLQRAEQALASAQADRQRAATQAEEPGTDRQWYRNWIVGLRAAIARRSDELASCRRAREKALEHAMRARRALRVIERLRDRRFRAFQLEASRREQRQIDELGTQRYQAGQRASGGFT